jgi:heme/copper-type cytochrome/quinol oxidase subunit 4
MRAVAAVLIAMRRRRKRRSNINTITTIAAATLIQTLLLFLQMNNQIRNTKLYEDVEDTNSLFEVQFTSNVHFTVESPFTRPL